MVNHIDRGFNVGVESLRVRLPVSQGPSHERVQFTKRSQNGRYTIPRDLIAHATGPVLFLVANGTIQPGTQLRMDYGRDANLLNNIQHATLGHTHTPRGVQLQLLPCAMPMHLNERGHRLDCITVSLSDKQKCGRSCGCPSRRWHVCNHVVLLGPVS